MYCFKKCFHIAFDKVTKNSGSLIMLKINYKLSTEGTVSWRKDGSLATDSRHILAQDNSLVITDLTKADEGVYEALDDQKRTVAKYHLSIETGRQKATMMQLFTVNCATSCLVCST